MNVLNVNMSLDPVSGGGTAERTFQMSRFLVKAGVNCSILTTDVGLTAERLEMLNGVEVVAYRCLWRRFYIPRLSVRKLIALIRRADVVHLMGHWNLLNAVVYIAVRRFGKSYVVCPAGALPIYGRSKTLKRVYNRIIGRDIVRNANRCIAIAESEREDIREYGVPPEKIVSIPNGINSQEIPKPETAKILKKHGLEGVRFVLFLGRLNQIKGPDLLLHAFCNLKDLFSSYHLVFVGPDDGMLAELESIAAGRGMAERVHFIGYLDSLAKYQVYYAADLLVIPSRKEAMSIVVLEAGAVGTPVLITDQCGLNELAQAGCGLVVSPSVQGLQEGLQEALGNQDRMKSMGSNLKRYTDENFSWERIAAKYLQMYSQITTRAGVN